MTRSTHPFTRSRMHPLIVAWVLGSLWLAWECRDSVVLSNLFVLQARVVLRH